MAGSSPDRRPARRRAGLFPGILLLATFASTPSPSAGETLSFETLAFTAEDRILILAPHPDDEVLGCGGILQKAVQAGLPLRVLFLTHGDNNEWSFLVYRKRPVLLPRAVRRMGQVRQAEALEAAKILGLKPEHLIFLGYPDAGTLKIWTVHWGKRPPLRGMLTRVTRVPYPEAFRFAAAYKGEEILADLKQVLLEFRPTRVFVSHPADRNLDHRALYLFTRVALWDLAQEMNPQVHPYLIHYPWWPVPRGDWPDRPQTPPERLRMTAVWRVAPLEEEQRQRKRRALQAHRSQYQYSARALLSFVRANELFGDPPPITASALRATPDVSLVTASGSGRLDPSEGLTAQARAAFVGIQEELVRQEGEDLVFQVVLSKSLAEDVQLSLLLFGYRSDVPFAQMPKLHVRIDRFGEVVLDQKRRLPADQVAVERKRRALTLRVPLRLMGNPQRVLTTLRSDRGEIPLDRTDWRILEVL